jgi:hypothetical protein
MAIADRTKPVVETKTVVVQEGFVKLNLTDEEAKQLTALLGQGIAAEWCKDNAPIMRIYRALSAAYKEYDAWTEYQVVDDGGHIIPPYVVKPRSR